MKLTSVASLASSLAPSLESRAEADLLVLPFWEGGREAADLGSLTKNFTHFLKTGDFKGKQGETALLYLEGEKELRTLLIGLGKEEKATPIWAQCLRSARGSARLVSEINVPD